MSAIRNQLRNLSDDQLADLARRKVPPGHTATIMLQSESDGLVLGLGFRIIGEGGKVEILRTLKKGDEYTETVEACDNALYAAVAALVCFQNEIMDPFMLAAQTGQALAGRLGAPPEITAGSKEGIARLLSEARAEVRKTREQEDPDAGVPVATEPLPNPPPAPHGFKIVTEAERRALGYPQAAGWCPAGHATQDEMIEDMKNAIETFAGRRPKPPFAHYAWVPAGTVAPRAAGLTHYVVAASAPA